MDHLGDKVVLMHTVQSNPCHDFLADAILFFQIPETP